MAAAGAAPRLTPEQARAIEAREVSVALSAGAGCGKTFVLTQRFLSHLDPTGPPLRRARGLGELVAITFTDRAAREMRDRIRKACRDRLVAAPPDEAGFWLERLREIESARISTIHSFCTSLLRAHAVEAGLDPRFVVLEAAPARTLQNEAIDDELRKLLASRNEAAMDLVLQFGVSGVRERIGKLLRQRADLDFEAWRDCTPDALLDRWERYHREVVVPQALEQALSMPESTRAISLLEELEIDHPLMTPRRNRVLSLFRGLRESRDLGADLDAIVKDAQVQHAHQKHWPSPEVYEEVKEALSALRGKLKALNVGLSFDRELARPAAVTGLQLLTVAERVHRAVEARMREMAVLDFDALLIYARDLLCNPRNEELRQQVAESITMLLVDEFQDTDPLQVRLIESICGDDLTRGKLFFVGDHKQSIYRFRGADPRVFRHLRKRTPDDGRLPLTRNFRSQPAILDFVNALFCDDLGENYEPLHANRPQVTPEPAVEFLWAETDDEEVQQNPKKREPVDEQRQREADWIARRLRQLFDSKQPLVPEEGSDPPRCRELRPGDVAILFRALSNVEHYEAALRRYGIDYYLVGGRAFYSQQEVFDLLNLLRSVSCPSDEVSLAGVLRSPFFSLADETLFWLAQHRDGLARGLFEALPPQLDAEQRRRVTFAAETITALREIKDRVAVTELIHRALSWTGYDAVLLAEFLGERKLANLRKLIEQARSFDRSGVFTLDDFIQELSDYVAKQPDEAPAATQGADTDVVRLMTIHQSKGLEFPLVVVPDLNRASVGGSESVRFDPELGPLVQMHSSQLEARATHGMTLYALREKEEEAAERARLLYVATTRAADYLILSAGVKQAGDGSSDWMKLLGSRFDLTTGALQVRLPEGYAVPKIAVTKSRPEPKSKALPQSRSVDLEKLVEEVTQMAAAGRGQVPRLVAPLAPDLRAQREFSFSALSGRLEPSHDELVAVETGDDPERSPLGYDPMGLGLLVHAALAAVDHGGPIDVQALVARYTDAFDAEGLARETAVELIERFLQSPRAEALRGARQIHPELEFLLAWPPGSAEPGGPQLRGYIDCLYQDAAGRWHVVDYKTNQVDANSLAVVAGGYELQMLVYCLAVEASTGQTPASCVLHFLRPGLEWEFAFDEPARQRGIELVNRAIAEEN